MLAVALIGIGGGVLLLWSAISGEDLRKVLPQILRDEYTKGGAAFPGGIGGGNFGPLPGSGGTLQPIALGNAKWQPSLVRKSATLIAREFGVPMGGQCRNRNVRPPGGSRTSDHYRCMAVDFPSSNDRKLLAMERWANTQPTFSQVIYSEETSYHRTGGANQHCHLSWADNGPPMRLPSGKVFPSQPSKKSMSV